MDNQAIIEDKEKCVLCQGQWFIFCYHGTDRLYGLPGVFKILKCSSCGLHTLRPKLSPEETGLYYPDEYLNFAKAIEDETSIFIFLDRFIAREKRVRQIIKRVSNPGRILDVGCATGILLSGMMQKGWECYGVEPNSKAAEYASERFGLEIYHGYLEDASYPSGSFDVVTMMDVLEHTYDPIRTLNELYRILKPGGIFFGTLPNFDAWERKWFGPFWIGWDVPRHYHVFNPRTIEMLLKQQGFNDVQIFSFTGRHGTFMLSLNNWLNSLDRPGWMKNLVRSVFKSMLARIMMIPLFYFSEQLNRSSILSFSARKD